MQVVHATRFCAPTSPIPLFDKKVGRGLVQPYQDSQEDMTGVLGSGKMISGSGSRQRTVDINTGDLQPFLIRDSPIMICVRKPDHICTYRSWVYSLLPWRRYWRRIIPLRSS